MTMPHVALIETPPRHVTYDRVRAAFDRAYAATEHWPVYAAVTLEKGDVAWVPDSTTRRYVAHRRTRVTYAQHQDGGVDMATAVA